MPHDFKLHETVIHPNHGAGSITARVKREIAGQHGDFLILTFPRTSLTVTIPEQMLERSGLRRPSSRSDMHAALDVLPRSSTEVKGTWSRAAAIYMAKLNSGQPTLIAEVVRDLGGHNGNGWKRKLYDEALVRLAEELALVEQIDLAEAQTNIEERRGHSMAASPPVETAPDA